MLDQFGGYVPDLNHPTPMPEITSSSSGTGGLTGNGNPEGVVPASAGTTYWDATNKIMYVKDTGAGSTGWRELVA